MDKERFTKMLKDDKVDDYSIEVAWDALEEAIIEDPRYVAFVDVQEFLLTRPAVVNPYTVKIRI